MKNQEVRNFWPKIGLVPILGFLALAGCGSPPQEVSASTPQPPVSKEVQDQAEGLINRFVADLATSKDDDIKQFTTPAMQKKIGPSAAKWVSGPEHPFIGASGWTFDMAENLSQGKKLVIHAHFLGADGKTYRTNFAFQVDGKNLLLNDLLTPSYATAPAAPKGAGQAKSPK